MEIPHLQSQHLNQSHCTEVITNYDFASNQKYPAPFFCPVVHITNHILLFSNLNVIAHVEVIFTNYVHRIYPYLIIITDAFYLIKLSNH